MDEKFKIPCIGCGCCCCDNTIVELNLNEWDAKYHIPWKYIDCSVNPPIMKKKENGYCLAFNDDKRCCGIYKKRPTGCRIFPAGNPECINSIKLCKNKSIIVNMSKKLKEIIKDF